MNLWSDARRALGKLYTYLYPPTPNDESAGSGAASWDDYHVRKSRYAMLWSFYNQSIYFGPHGEALRREFKLYKFIRPVYNACGRIVDFHAAHVMGGQLDQDAGDGKVKPSCLPFIPGEAASTSLRPALAALLRDSNWQVAKAIYTRWGVAMGDVGLEAVADTRRQKMRVRVVHPAEIEYAILDPYGNVRNYALQRWEIDPEDPSGRRPALYREVVRNDEGVVTFTTFKNGALYAWPGTPGSEWTFRWGFAPLAIVKNINNGTPWGESEIQGALAKTVECDDQGSNLGDQIRKAVNGPWFLKGASLAGSPPPLTPGGNGFLGDPFAPAYPPGGTAPTTPTLRVQVIERDGIPFITCNAADADVKPLAFPLPIDMADGHIRTILDSLERDYPELQADVAVVTGEAASGSAIEKARQKATDKVHERRSAYDAGFVKVAKMAMTIGADLGFPEYRALGAAAYEGGLLDFQIGERPVFSLTQAEKIEQEGKRAGAVKVYVEAGVPLGEALRLSGVSEEEVERVTEAADLQEEADQARREKARTALAAAQAARLGVVGADATGEPAATVAGEGPLEKVIPPASQKREVAA
jgi:hypothetical protein